MARLLPPQFITVVLMLLALLALGGMTAIGRGWGFAAAAVCPFALAIVRPLFRQFRNGAIQLHLEARTSLGLRYQNSEDSEIESPWVNLTTTCRRVDKDASSAARGNKWRSAVATLSRSSAATGNPSKMRAPDSAPAGSGSCSSLEAVHCDDLEASGWP